MGKKTAAENPVRRWLADKGVTQRQLAIDLNVTQPFLNQLLNGHYPNIGALLLDDLHRVTGLSYQELVTYFASAARERRAS